MSEEIRPYLGRQTVNLYLGSSSPVLPDPSLLHGAERGKDACPSDRVSGTESSPGPKVTSVCFGGKWPFRRRRGVSDESSKPVGAILLFVGDPVLEHPRCPVSPT